MQEHSELSKRRQLLQLHRGELEKLQSSKASSPSKSISKPSSVTSIPHAPPLSYDSELSKGIQPSKIPFQQTALKTGVDVAPRTKQLIENVADQVPHSACTANLLSSNAELLGDEEYMPDIKNWTLPEDKPTVEDDSAPTPLLGLAGDKNSPLTYYLKLLDDTVTTARCVTDLKFHRKFDDVILASYSQRCDGKLDCDLGVVALWGLGDGRGVLQRTLSAHAGVTALELMDISPTLVLGGTTGGNILMWDTRVKTALPITTFGPNLSDPTYSHGRHSVTGIRTPSASPSPYFFSSSASGYLYKWSLSNTDYPVTRSIVQDPVSVSELPISCFDLPRSTRIARDERSASARSVSVFAGSELGGIYRLNTGESSWQVEEECGMHLAAVTNISSHPFGTRVAYLDDVVVTSSSDWTIRLWLLRRGQECKELAMFDLVENGEVNDVKWSPQHPTVFCAGDDAGVLSLFDISGQLAPANELPFYQFSSPERKDRATISRVQWSNNSKFICAGDAEGKTTIWRCGSAFAGLPDADWTAQYLKAKQAEVSG